MGRFSALSTSIYATQSRKTTTRYTLNMSKLTVMPAAVTPFLQGGEIDSVSMARLLAFFDAAGCDSAVVGGTNGEGPLLSAVERRDLCIESCRSAGNLRIWLGTASESLPEVKWLAKQASKAGAAGLLLLPPKYFGDPGEEALSQWFEAIFDASDLPCLIYNIPQKTGYAFSVGLLKRLAAHPQFGGVKDASGDPANLVAYRQAVAEDHQLLFGDRHSLIDAVREGWTGTISGAANIIPQWFVQVLRETQNPELQESAGAKYELMSRILELVHVGPQPALHKAVLHAFGVLETADVRLPLQPCSEQVRDNMLDVLVESIGVRPGNLGLIAR